MKFLIFVILCFGLVQSANITEMQCNEDARTCTATGGLGLTVDFSRKFTGKIEFVIPQPPEQCNSSQRLCYGKQATADKVSVNGVVTDKSVSYFRFTSEKGQSALTILNRGGETPNPVCPSGRYCTFPEIVTLDESGTVTTTGTVQVPVAFAKPVVKAFKSDGVTEVPDVFGPAPDKLEITDPARGQTTIALEGVMTNAEVDRLQLVSGTYVRSIMLYRSGGAIACGAGYECSNPPSAQVGAGNRLNVPAMTIDFASAELKVQAFAGRKQVYGVTGFSRSCDKTRLACVRVRRGNSYVYVRGRISNPDVAGIQFYSWADIIMFIKRPGVANCPWGAVCTDPKTITVSTEGAITTTTLTTPFQFTTFTAVGLAGNTEKPDVFGGENCDPSKVACATGGPNPSAVAITGNLTKVPFRVGVLFEDQEPWYFIFSSASTIGSALLLIIGAAMLVN